MSPERRPTTVLLSTSLCAALCVAWLAACAVAQTPPREEPSAPIGDGVPAGIPLADEAAPTADDTVLAARAALERAAHFQRGKTPRAAPRSLHGRFYVGLRGEDGSMIKADVERWFSVSPERMLTTRTEKVTGSTSSVGWDGRRAWFRDQASGDTVVYTDDPGTFDEDLAQLREQVRLTRLLLDACVIDALSSRLLDARVTGTRTVEDLDGDTHTVEVVQARVVDELFGPVPGAPPPGPEDPAPMLEVELGIDAESGALRTLAVSAPHRSDIAPLRLRFDFYGTSSDGLRVPGNIRVFQGGETRERMTLGVEVRVGDDGEEWLGFDVDAVLDETLFAVPR